MPGAREPARVEPAAAPAARGRERPQRQRVPHTSFATWEPPEEKDDDQPLITRTAGDAEAAVSARHDTDRPPPPPPSKGSFLADDPSFAQIFVNVGRRDGARPEDFQRMLAEGAGIAVEGSGRIRVRDRMTFVSVKKDDLDRAIAAFTGQVIGGRNVVAEVARPRT